MKKLTFFFAIIALLSSCKAYQMSTISSLDAKLDSTGVFKIENDSLSLSYNFTGENEPLNIEVFNKLNEPLYVNWAKSAMISSDKAYSYASDEIRIQGSTSSISTQYSRRGDVFTDGSISATAKLSQYETFIPPHSKINRTIYILKNLETDKLLKADFQKVYLNYDDGSGLAPGKRASFSADHSPLKFKSYLTMYTMKDNQPMVFSRQQEFFISGIVKTAVSPSSLYEFKHNRGDVIVNAKTTGYAKTIAVIGLVGAVGALTAAETTLNEKNQPK